MIQLTNKKPPAAIVKHARVTVNIWEVCAPTTKSKVAYRFRLPGRKSVTRADLEAAKLEAKKAAQLMTQGAADTTSVTVADLSELAAVRRLADERGVPSVAAMQEWSVAKELAGAALLSIAKEHAEAIADGKHERVTHAIAWERFIKAKNDAKKKGTRTYTSKAGMIKRGLGADIMLDTLTTTKIAKWSVTVVDPGTRNDLLKRLGTMMRWAQRNNLFPSDRLVPSDNVDRAEEPEEDPGIVTPAQLKKCLDWIRANHIQYLAATAICSLGGMRSDEVHSKRADKEKPRSEMPRQLWQHVRVKPQTADGTFGYIQVTVAKKNTPSNRKIPIQPALAAWLALCPRDVDSGNVCIAGAMERVRELLRKADTDLGFPKTTVEIGGKKVEVNDIPENCFRHAFISHRLPVVGIVQTAAEAGNSPHEIEKSYRVPLDVEEALPYWEVLPD